MCDRYWDMADANVTCRQLGYPLGARRMTHNTAFGLGSVAGQGYSAYAMSDMRCFGNETSLLDCPYSDPSRYCNSWDAAGVVCNGIVTLPD